MDVWKKSGSMPYLLLAVALIVLASRVPFISAGIGLDPDSYRLVTSANYIASKGEYIVSRYPGYPAVEYLLSLFGTTNNPVFSNGLSGLASVAAVVLMVLLLGASGAKNIWALPVGFAMVPVVWVNSTVTMDFMPALAFSMAAGYCLVLRKPALAGAFLGLAIGCRITSGALVLLAIPLFWAERKSPAKALRAVSKFGLSALVVTALVYFPVWERYGFSFLKFSELPSYPGLPRLLQIGVLEVWGWIGLAGWVFAILSFVVLKLFFQPVKKSGKQNTVFRASLLVMVLYLALFLRLPSEAGYLIPFVAAALIAAAMVLPAKIQWVFAGVLVISPLAGVHGGNIFEVHTARLASERLAAQTIETAKTLPDSAVIVAGWRLPQIRYRLLSDGFDKTRWIYLFDSEADLANTVADGRAVYYLDQIDRFSKAATGIDLPEMGARPFPALIE